MPFHPVDTNKTEGNVRGAKENDRVQNNVQSNVQGNITKQQRMSNHISRTMLMVDIESKFLQDIFYCLYFFLKHLLDITSFHCLLELRGFFCFVLGFCFALFCFFSSSWLYF